MSGDTSVSVVAPFYNEEEILRETIAKFDELSEYSFVDNVYLMDDASEDGSSAVVTEYFEEQGYDGSRTTDLKHARMLENGNAVGAIEEAVAHIDSDQVLMIASDSYPLNPDEIEDAVEQLESSDDSAYCFKVFQPPAEDTWRSKFLSAWQDLYQAEKRMIESYTTGNIPENEAVEGKVFSLNVGALFEKDVLEDALENHSGKRGYDSEFATIIQFELDESVDYYSDLVFSTPAVPDYDSHFEQIKRWDEGAMRVSHEFSQDFLGEMRNFSRFGHALFYKAGKSAVPGLFIGASIVAATEDPDLALDIAKTGYGIDAGFNTVLGIYAWKNDELRTPKSIAATTLLPLHHTLNYIFSGFPSQIGQTKEIASNLLENQTEKFGDIQKYLENED